LNVQFSQKVNQ